MLRRCAPGAMVAVFLICLTSFAVALTLGGGPRATTVELAIFQAIRFEFDLGRAALLAALQFALCGAAVLARGPACGDHRIWRRARSARRAVGCPKNGSAIARYGCDRACGPVPAAAGGPCGGAWLRGAVGLAARHMGRGDAIGQRRPGFNRALHGGGDGSGACGAAGRGLDGGGGYAAAGGIIARSGDRAVPDRASAGRAGTCRLAGDGAGQCGDGLALCAAAAVAGAARDRGRPRAACRRAWPGRMGTVALADPAAAAPGAGVQRRGGRSPLDGRSGGDRACSPARTRPPCPLWCNG